MNRRELLATWGSMTAFGAVGCSAPDSDESTATPTAERGMGAAIEDADEWPMFLFDSTHRRCFARERLPAGDPAIRWSYGTDGAIWSSPAVADGTLYIGSYDGHLYAISIETGDLLWRYRTGDRIDGSPAVADGTVYVGSFDRNVYALDAETGAERWVYGTRGIVRSSPTVRDGVVYIGAHCRTEECSAYYDVRWPERGFVYALDADHGDLRWRYETGDGVVSTPAVADGAVYVGSSDNSLYAIEADTGVLRWRYETGGAIMSSPTCVDGWVFVGNIVGEVYAVDAAAGDVQWRFDADRGVAGGADLQVVITGSPVVCNGSLYVGSIVPADQLYGRLVALSAADGTHEWSQSPYAQAIGSSPAVDNGTVYFGAHTFGPAEGVVPGVYAVGTDGTDRWSYTVDGESHRGFGSSPAVVGSTLYIGSTDGHVLAFGLD